MKSPKTSTAFKASSETHFKTKMIRALKKRPAAPDLFLQKGLQALSTLEPPPLSRALAALGPLPEQPLDGHLLAISPLYRASRARFLGAGGKFRATLVSSGRTLSSSILLTPWIEYSPIERELFWTATDERERGDTRRLLELRAFSSSLYHEQNHRALWRELPPPAPIRRSDRGTVARYLNFVEAIVIASDMALGDELGPELAPLFYQVGVTYDPGSAIRGELKRSREYRNYLHAAVQATYMALELYERSDIERAVRALHPLGTKLTDRAVERALKLDQAFIRITNLDWQEKHEHEVARALRKRAEPLVIPRDPLDNCLIYLFAERWFEALGI